ncbi:MAG TPA: riboflavin synthase [Flavisolibacter sp.]|nr:riboflavin synthase [Flavisolibacter sp.]
MFTGIIEALGLVKAVSASGTNKHFWVESPLSAEFKIDQSIAHNGVCLTVEAVENGSHRVTAVQETLEKTELNAWQPGRRVNLERSLLPSSRLDGHFVQGHVDARGRCLSIIDRQGSFEIEFGFPDEFGPLVIEKGSICINGISLTAFGVGKDHFRVAIIPYTYEHTNLQFLSEGDEVNLEFDMIGKYIVRKLSLGKTT